MALSLSLNNLASRQVRRTIGNNGVRRFARNAIEQQRDESGNIIQQLWNGFTRFGGFLLNAVMSVLGIVGFGLATLWGWITAAAQFLWNFNWNASDQELEQSIAGAFNALGSVLGGTIGSALGYLACGAVPGAIIFAFNEPMGAYVLKEVGEEAFEEIASNVAVLIRQTGALLVRSSVVWLYKNIRTLWRTPDNEFKRQLIAQGGLTPEQIDKAVNAHKKPCSMALGFENFIDSIDNQFIKNFTEEAVEEFSDSCIEAGYVVANAVDCYQANQRLSNNGFFGSDRTVEITLNRDADSATTP